MAKYYKIRWTEDDNRELEKAVRNFNAKLRRLEKKNPEIYNKNTLPQFYDKKTDSYTQRLSVRQMKDLINTRQDLKRELNSLKRFSKRGSEQIYEVPTNDGTLELTKWQYNEMNKRVAYINRRKAIRLKQIEETEVHDAKGKPLGYTRGQLGMGKQYKHDLSPIEAFNPSIENYSLKKKWNSILRQSQRDYFNKRDYQLRENFIEGLMKNYNYNDIEDIVASIKEMPLDEFLNEYLKDPDAFEWAYYPNLDEYEGYLSKLESTWLPHYNEEVFLEGASGTSTPIIPKKVKGKVIKKSKVKKG